MSIVPFCIWRRFE